MIKFTTEELEQLISEINDKLFPAHELIKTRHKWKAYLSATQTNIANVTTTTIEFDSLDFDCEGGGIDSFGYTCPERGIYLVCLDVLWGSLIAGNRYDGRIYRNGTIMTYGIRHSGHTGRVSGGGTVLVPVDRNDVIYGKVYHDDGSANPDIIGGSITDTTMDIHLISRRCT